MLFDIDEDKKLDNVKEFAKDLNPNLRLGSKSLAALTDLGKIASGIPIPINLFEKMIDPI
ncbi:MAG: hypothetical protein ACE5KE_02565 [Methanosarcinales archaeon]